jgi:hypothetical protein
MSKCTVCGEDRSPFVMNNKTVCLKCDELLFDIEIESEEEQTAKGADKQLEKGKLTPKQVPVVVKK